MIVLTTIFLILLIVILFLFKKKMIVLMLILLIISVACLSFKIIKGYLPVPVGIRHFVHLLIPPKDLRNPIVTDNFLFYERGFNRTYHLEPKYLDFYECGFSIDDEIPSDYKFNGELRFEFYSGEQKLFEKTVNQWETFGKNYVSLINFEIPILGKYIKDISIKVTVLEPDRELKDKKSLKLYIAVSGTP